MLGTALNRDDLDQEAPTRLDEPACETTLEPLLQIDQSERSIPGFPSSHKLDESSISPPPLAGLVFFQSIYFLSGLSASTWGRFAVIYYNQVKHLSAEQIGILQGLLRLAGFVSVPMWGYLADIIQSRKRVYLATSIINTLSLLSLSLKAVDTFGKTLICVLGMALFKSSGVLDAHTLDFLGERHRGMYGTIRLYMALSWGIGAVLMGWITDSFGFDWNFGLFGSMMIAVVSQAGSSKRVGAS